MAGAIVLTASSRDKAVVLTQPPVPQALPLNPFGISLQASSAVVKGEELWATTEGYRR
jgi:hypothetical protein